jgi:indolepyruvate ferredoxin oxidoreductase beta subunit
MPQAGDQAVVSTEGGAMKKLDLFITGVGGQGNILASDIAAEVALAAGFDVKKTDTLGMAQRGGSVISHVRIADKVYSPLIKEGGVDILLGFEKLEAVRWASHLKPGAIAIVNDFVQPPLSVNLGIDRYPSDEEVTAILKQRAGKILLVDGTHRVTELGNSRTLNVFMLGCLSRFLPFKVEMWRESILAHLPQRLHKINTDAFDLGRKEVADA